MRGSKQDVTIYDYLPHLARIYSDAYGMLGAGCWTDEVNLRQANGTPFKEPRRLRIQLSGSPIEWGNWGEGETLTASERIPDGLLGCLLYAPHHWLESGALVNFVRYVDSHTANKSLEILCEKMVSDQMLSGDFPEEARRRGRKAIEEHRSSSLDERAMKEFALLLDTVSGQKCRGGPPWNGMVFARELKRRLVGAGAQTESADRQVRELIFGGYLPGRDRAKITLDFFLETANFLRAAAGVPLNSVPEAVATRAILQTEKVVRSSVEGYYGQKRIVKEMRVVLLRLVYEEKNPTFGNSPDYMKCLKAASLVDDHGYDEEVVARLLGLAEDRVPSGGGAKGKAHLITSQRRQRLERYLRNGRAIRRAIPGEFLVDNKLDLKIK